MHVSMCTDENIKPYISDVLVYVVKFIMCQAWLVGCETQLEKQERIHKWRSPVDHFLPTTALWRHTM